MIVNTPLIDITKHFQLDVFGSLCVCVIISVTLTL